MFSVVVVWRGLGELILFIAQEKAAREKAAREKAALEKAALEPVEQQQAASSSSRKVKKYHVRVVPVPPPPPPPVQPNPFAIVQAHVGMFYWYGFCLGVGFWSWF